MRRYGEPDLVTRRDEGVMEAQWCEQGAKRCNKQSDKGMLSVIWYPEFGVSDGDKILQGAAANFTLDEGPERSGLREDAAEALPTQDPAAARRLHAQCVSPAGKFADDDAFDIHTLGLVHYLDGAARIVWHPRQVPDPVFAAFGIDAKRAFGEGVCFHSSDFIFERSECPGGLSSAGFRWAQRAGLRWLVAMRYGGVALRRRYYVVERQGDGSFLKIWWNSELAPLSGWLAAGAKPMTGKSW